MRQTQRRCAGPGGACARTGAETARAGRAPSLRRFTALPTMSGAPYDAPGDPGARRVAHSPDESARELHHCLSAWSVEGF